MQAIGCLVGGNRLAGELPAPFDTELGHRYRAGLTLAQVAQCRPPPGRVFEIVAKVDFVGPAKPIN